MRAFIFKLTPPDAGPVLRTFHARDERGAVIQATYFIHTGPFPKNTKLDLLDSWWVAREPRTHF